MRKQLIQLLKLYPIIYKKSQNYKQLNIVNYKFKFKKSLIIYSNLYAILIRSQKMLQLSNLNKNYHKYKQQLYQLLLQRKHALLRCQIPMNSLLNLKSLIIKLNIQKDVIINCYILRSIIYNDKLNNERRIINKIRDSQNLK